MVGISLIKLPYKDPSYSIWFAVQVNQLTVCNVDFIISINVQQDATMRSLFYLQNAVHVSGGFSTHHQRHKELYLQHLVRVNFIATCRYPGGVESLNSCTLATGSNNG